MSFNGLTTHSVYQPFMDPTDEKVLQQMTLPLFTASPQISIPTPEASTRASSPRMPTPELTSAFEDAYSSSLDYGSYEIDDITTTTTATMHDGDATQKMTPQEFMEEILSSSPSSSSQWPVVDAQGTVMADVCNRCGLQWVEGDKCLICDGGDSVCLDWTLSDDANLTVPSSMMAAEEIEELASYNHLEDAFHAYEEQCRYEEQQQQQHLLLLQDNAVDESSATETSPDEDDARSPLARESFLDGLRIKAPI